MEREDKEIMYDGSDFSFEIRPLEIKTFKVEFEN
jgi:hypothetical protein